MRPVPNRHALMEMQRLEIPKHMATRARRSDVVVTGGEAVHVDVARLQHWHDPEVQRHDVHRSV